MRRAGLLLAVLGLGGCAVGPEYEGPPDTPGQELSWDRDDASAMPEDSPELEWWTVFGDPMLADLVAEAVANNRDLRAAAQRVVRARALRGEASAGFWPDLSVGGGHTRESTSAALGRGDDGGSAQSVYRGGFDASWELDVFGGVRRSEEAADARIGVALEDERTLRLSLISEVARSYIEYRGLQARIAILTQNIDLQAETVDLVQARYDVGEASEFDLTRARGQLRGTSALLPRFEADLAATGFRLAVLLGRPPNGIAASLGEFTGRGAVPDRLPVGQRSDLLRRRPDIRAAERELASATAEIGVAQADLFPRFFLVGTAGRAARTLDDLRDSSADFYSFGQLFEWPLFEGGALRSALAVAEAEAAEAAALYEQAVLEALADAETALNRFVRSHQALALLEESFASRRRSADLARALFEAGEQDFLAVIDAERDRAEADDALVLGEIGVRLAAVNLFAALGGGWEVFEAGE